jgi:hypothetical protein
MTGAPKRTTAAHEILLAANDLASEGKAEFSEWDLTVASWKRDKNRFGCRGYEDNYPDHKRVMMEIMGQTKKDNPLRRGWLIKSRPNHYEITALGRNEATKIALVSQGQSATERSPQDLYDAIAPYFNSLTFKKFMKDEAEPKMWLGAASFLGLSRNDALHLSDKLAAANSAITQSLKWFEETKQSALRRGASGGPGVSITKADADKLAALLESIQARFKVQIEAIQRQKK